MRNEDPSWKICLKILTAHKRKFLHRYTIPEMKSLYKTQYISGNFSIHIYSIINVYLMKNIIFCIWPMTSSEIIAEIFTTGQWILQLRISENIKTDKKYKILTYQNHFEMVQTISGNIKNYNIFTLIFRQNLHFRLRFFGTPGTKN